MQLQRNPTFREVLPSPNIWELQCATRSDATACSNTERPDPGSARARPNTRKTHARADSWRLGMPR